MSRSREVLMSNKKICSQSRGKYQLNLNERPSVSISVKKGKIQEGEREGGLVQKKNGHIRRDESLREGLRREIVSTRKKGEV